MKQERLKQEVERVLGHQLREARDFEYLSECMLKCGSHERLSPTTLKRLWGYLKNEQVQTRPHTLDVLARFVGYKDYDDFCKNDSQNDEEQSGVIIAERIVSRELPRGRKLVIRWLPDRRIVVKHQGNGQFVVLESEHSKLSVGDTFVCHLMLEHEPLYLDQLVHDGMPSMNYVAGQRNGVVFEMAD